MRRYETNARGAFYKGTSTQNLITGIDLHPAGFERPVQIAEIDLPFSR
jgi:hypothetical protein